MMAATSVRLFAICAIALVTLSGCETLPNPFAAKETSGPDQITTDAARSVRLVDRDVEAPEVFQTTETALWDGRMSLGGVWVASPDAVNPERVILRNEANGKFVIGALYRRERDNPGPKLQISSEAADALGMLAGQPGQLNVTALRREDSVAQTAPAAALPAAAAEEAASADPIAAAGAAIDRADGVEPAEGEDALAAAPAPQDDLDPTPRIGETKRAARKRARLAAKAAAEQPPVGGPTLDTPLAAAEAIDVAPLADVATTAEAAAVVAPVPSGGSARVQIGIFSVEANAQRAVDTLKAGGVDAQMRKDESNGKVFWSVIARGDGGDKTLLAKVKDLGFADAYAVSG